MVIPELNPELIAELIAELIPELIAELIAELIPELMFNISHDLHLVDLSRALYMLYDHQHDPKSDHADNSRHHFQTADHIDQQVDL